MTWGTPVEQERRRRIRLSVAAYAYEIAAEPIMSDAEYDALAHEVDVRVMTGHPVFDEFFVAEYQPYTGAWVRRHPDQPGLRRLLNIQRRKA